MQLIYEELRQVHNEIIWLGHNYDWGLKEEKNT